MNHHGRKMALAVGSNLAEPIVAVRWWAPRDFRDSGFEVWYSDAPTDREVGEDDLSAVCTHCLIERFPVIGVAMDAARKSPGMFIPVE